MATVLDLARMRRERMAKLHAEVDQRGLAALLLLTSGNVIYATGAKGVMADNQRVYQQRTTALVVAGDPFPHLFTPFPEGAPPELPEDHVHPPLHLETDAGVDDLARRLKELLGGASGAIGIDDYTMPMFLRLPGLLAPAELVECGSILTQVRLHKTPDEVECMRRSWQINEAATYAVEQAVKPGVRLTELSGTSLRHLFEHGATSNFLDPVFQVMPERIEDGPWSVNGDVPFNLVTTDRILTAGDVVWTDTVSGYEGYASDVGRTWVVGKPSAELRDLYRRWQEITDVVLDHLRPGVTGDVLTRLAVEANGGTKPWLAHFFLAHGLGIEGGEPQQVGADRGPEYDESFTLEPGMAIVIEPVTWEDGHAGWRCEELVIITDDGHDRISAYPNEIEGLS